MEREIIDLTPESLNDVDNAGRMMRWHGNEIRFCDDARKWMRYSGKYWEIVSEDTITNYARATLETMVAASRNAETAAIKEMNALPKEDPARKEKQAAINNHAKVIAMLPKFKNASHIRGMVQMARGWRPFKMAEFDKDPYLLNCANGVLNLKTGEFLPHSSSQYFMKCTGTDYNPGADASFWDARVEEVLPAEETRHWVQMYVGYCLTGLVGEAIFPVFIGSGKNGKTTFVEAIRHAMGTYADTVPPEMFIGSGDPRNDGGRATPTTAKLRGIRLATCEEVTPGRALNVAAIKNLTGGADITARMLYGDPFTYTPTCKFIMGANVLLHIKDTTDGGTTRRLVAVPFPATFQHPRKHLGEDLQKPENRQAILQWAVDGLKMYWDSAEGLDNRPPEIEAATKDWVRQEDVLGGFIFSGYCQLDPEAEEPTQNLYDQFCIWFRDTHTGNAVVINSVNEFSRRLSVWNPDVVRRVHTRAGNKFRGVRLTYAKYGHKW